MVLHRALAGASLLGLLCSCQSAAPIKVRLSKNAVEGSRSAALADAKAQFAFGNPALALEKFRTAVREDPDNVEALSGIASCYQALGRPELAQRNYELALAVRPNDRGLLTALAGTLDAQGLVAEAARGRSELAGVEAAELALNSAPIAAGVPAMDEAPAIALTQDPQEQVRPQPSPVAVAAAPVAPARSVTVTLAPARPALDVVAGGKDIGRSVSVALAPARGTPGPAARVRLDRLSLSEVALTTAASPVWKSVKMAAAEYSVARRGIQSPPSIQIRNGARVAGLAASTRDYLRQRGWRGIQIGDAQGRRERTIIYAPRGRARTAVALAAQFRFPVQVASTSGDLVVILGRDAAAMQERRRG